jgi:hypothetical protein
MVYYRLLLQQRHSLLFAQKWVLNVKERERANAHLLILWGSFSDDMTITGIGFRELIA